MSAGETHEYILTFRCVYCGRYEVFACHHSDSVLHEDQIRDRIYQVCCKACGWKGGAYGISAARISCRSELKEKEKTAGQGN